jgi:dihydrofolate synthase/folylpolyglutamate synthase
VGAITSIGFDHQQHLGHSLAAIANEKAGIIKPGMTVVTGVLPHEAREVIEAVAGDRGAHILVAPENVRVEAMLEDDRTVLEVNTPDGEYGPVRLGLRGNHQIGNAIVAIRLLEAARVADIHVPRAAVERGLRDVEWPARLETIDLGRGLWALLDAAHNPDGARALAAYIRDRGSVRPTIVLGVMRDKDASPFCGRSSRSPLRSSRRPPIRGARWARQSWRRGSVRWSHPCPCARCPVRCRRWSRRCCSGLPCA